MSQSAHNVLVIMSDEHANRYLGCYGHPVVGTPHIDALAARGTRFANAYSTSPICMPARATFSTGRYPHETGHWCNATPYDGRVPSWRHALQAAGVPVSSIGKLHFSGPDAPTGFDRQIEPMHAVNGLGDLLGALRQSAPLPPRKKSYVVAQEIGAGESSYTRYDRSITEHAVRFLHEEAATSSRPWVLYVGLVAPHFPLIAPEAFFARYRPDEMAMPKAYRPEDWPEHPWLDELRKAYITDTFFDDQRRRIAIAAYFGLCSFLDDNVGQILGALDAAGLTDSTLVAHVSDHGDNLGARGLWQKSVFYEEAAAVPLVLAGPGVPAAKACSTPVSLVDFFPTILGAAGVPPPEDAASHGRSLVEIANAPDDDSRTVFGEYHAAGAVSGAFMLRRASWKYVHYVGYPPQLFDLERDPEELDDLAASPEHAPRVAAFEAELRAMLSPEDVDARAKADQGEIVERFGGREEVLARGSFGATPPPGQDISFG